MKKNIRGILLTFLFGMFTVSQASAIQQNHGQSVSGVHADDAREILENRIAKARTSGIISVLDERIKDEDVLAKTREKLLTLNVEKIELVSSLCDRVTESDGTPQADIVFSLVTTLIVLS